MNLTQTARLDAFASPPAHEPLLSECTFYHTMEIPGFGVQRGCWDLRPNIRDYLGAVNFEGARALEIGTANGFVCFEIERRGGEVVAFDLDENLIYDAPPLLAEQLATDTYRDGLRRIRNGFWLAHRRLGSRAKAIYGHANCLPAVLGEFDVGVMANVLQHIQDPIGALMQLASRCNSVVVTEADWCDGINDDLTGMIYFDDGNPFTWYQIKPNLIKAALKAMGFSRFEQTRHYQQFVKAALHQDGVGAVGQDMGIDVPHYTIVAYRS